MKNLPNLRQEKVDAHEKHPTIPVGTIWVQGRDLRKRGINSGSDLRIVRQIGKTLGLLNSARIDRSQVSREAIR